MGSQIDYQVGLSPETVYGTAVVASRFFESEVAMDFTPVKVQGSGTRPGKAVNRLKRNKLARIEVSGSQDIEVPTSGFGILLKAALGSVTSAQIGSSGVYQHVATRSTDDYLDSYTLQGVVPLLGSVQSAFTYLGCMAKSIEFSVSEGGILTAKIEWTGQDLDMTPAAAVASYPDSDLFTFVDGTLLASTTGTQTAPTATALGTEPSINQLAPNVTSFSLKIDNGLDSGGYVLGGAGKRKRKNALGMRGITGKMTVEFTSNALATAYRNQTAAHALLTFLGPQIGLDGSTPVYATLQLVIPSLLLKGGIPKSNKAGVITVDADFEVFDNGVSAQPIYVVYRSTDVTP